MSELWDIYDKNRRKKNKIVHRGDYLLDDEFHLVVNVWIKNSNNEFLITQRSENKSFPLMWECTGGSALSGETSLDAAIREVKEELGIDVSKSKHYLLGTKNRYYKGCPDILDVWIFEKDVDIKNVHVQKEEVNDVKWADYETIKKMSDNGKFESNAFFHEALSKIKNYKYYIGLSANNSICNELFFDGSFTIYPNNEMGNIYYSNKVLNDTKSELFFNNYKKFIINNINSIHKKNNNTSFIIFNKKVFDLFKKNKEINIIYNFNNSLSIDLNDKIMTRDMFSDIVPVLKYDIVEHNLEEMIKKKLKDNDSIVVQGKSGSGGENTYKVSNIEDIDLNSISTPCTITKYIKHIPLNITLIISNDKVISFPISVQLIKNINNKLKYVGGDFNYTKKIDRSILKKINEYSLKIANRLKKKGYRGILGIDYLLDVDNNIYFTEVNPRFQSSSFLINKYLEKECSTCLAELHYKAITGSKIGTIKIDNINESFLNCYKKDDFNQIRGYTIINNGYYYKNSSSYFRKIFERSILFEDIFERID